MIRLIAAAIVLSLVGTITTATAALAAAAPPPPTTTEMFTAVVDIDSLEIHRETDTPNSSWNPDEPTILTWSYQFEFGNPNSGKAQYLGRTTFSGRDARKSGGVEIKDRDGRFELPPTPANANFATGTLSLVLDSDNCSWLTYSLLGTIMLKAIPPALNAFAAANENVLALVGKDDPLKDVTDELKLEPTEWQKAQIVTDCLTHWSSGVSLDFDDFIGIGGTMILGGPPVPLLCQEAAKASGDGGTETLIDFDKTVNINNPFNGNVLHSQRFRIKETVEVWFDAAVMENHRPFGWHFNDDDGFYSLRGDIQVESSQAGDCPKPAPETPEVVVPEISYQCAKLLLDLEKGVLDYNTYLRLIRNYDCPDLMP